MLLILTFETWSLSYADYYPKRLNMTLHVQWQYNTQHYNN